MQHGSYSKQNAGQRLRVGGLFLCALACACSVPSVSIGKQGGSGGNATAPGGGSGTGAGGGGTTNSGTGAGVGSAGGAGGGQDSWAGLDAGLADFCRGNAPVPVSVGGATLCSGDLGKRTFTFAVCSCSDFKVGNVFEAKSFSGGKGGSVGVNGSFSVGNVCNVGGTIWASQDVELGNIIDVGRDVLAGRNVSIMRGIIWRDLFAVGKVWSTGVSVRTAYVSTDSEVDGVHQVVMRSNPKVAQPCDCSGSIDVGAITSFFKSVSDNTARGVIPTALNGDSNLTLECGRYFFNGVSSSGSTRIRTRGRVVIAIEGDIKAGNTFELVPEPGSEVDLFVQGNVRLGDHATIGDSARPSAARIYVGGTEVYSANAFTLSANVYAAKANFTTYNALDMNGALFVGRFETGNAVNVNYDNAILDLDGCATGAGCSSCRQCANPTPACHGGKCERCKTNSDCCPPLACNVTTGQCVDSVIN